MREQQSHRELSIREKKNGRLWGGKRQQRVSGKAVKRDLQMRNMKDHG